MMVPSRVMTRAFLLVALSPAFSVTQTYPRWFLDPGDLHCALTACGYAQNYYHRKSSDSLAFANGCRNLTIDRFVKIEGGEAYWATEAGVYWMGNDLKETIDSSFLRQSVSMCKKVASYSSKEMTIMLVSEGDCSLPPSMQQLVKCPRIRPRWVDSLPQKHGYIYDEGVAPEYFYESSSWQSAERKATFNLARDLKSTIEALEKLDNNSGQDISNVTISAELRDIQVVRRWRDVNDGLHYVLVRTRAW